MTKGEFMKIGIGVITTGDRDLPDYLCGEEVTISVYEDKDRKGPGYARNRVLKSLYDEGCDIIFLMDDDVWPMRKEWVSFAVDAAKNRGLDFIGWPHIFDKDPSGYEDGMLICEGVTVQFAMVTRKCVETIGYFDLAYGKYGPEDVSYAYRAHLAGLGSKNGFGWEIPLKLLHSIHVEDMYSCFEKSVVSLEVKKDGMEKGVKLLQSLVDNEGPIYVPYA